MVQRKNLMVGNYLEYNGMPYRVIQINGIVIDGWMLENGEEDCGEPIADGFYFTYCYPGFTGADLVEEMMYYGISAISLDSCGSTKQGIRACTSLIQRDEIPVLAERLAAFAKDHPVK